MAMTLKAARVNKGLTQDEAAKALHISVEALRKYEKGITSPTVAILKRIEEVYEVPYSGLIF